MNLLAVFYSPVDSQMTNLRGPRFYRGPSFARTYAAAIGYLAVNIADREQAILFLGPG